MKSSNKEILIWSFLDAAGVFFYVMIVAWIMTNGESIFGQMRSFIGPVIFLLLFVLSASITASLVLGRPIWYYLDGRKKDAIKLLGFTMAWIFILILTAIGVMLAGR